MYYAEKPSVFISLFIGSRQEIYGIFLKSFIFPEIFRKYVLIG